MVAIYWFTSYQKCIMISLSPRPLPRLGWSLKALWIYVPWWLRVWSFSFSQVFIDHWYFGFPLTKHSLGILPTGAAGVEDLTVSHIYVWLFYLLTQRWGCVTHSFQKGTWKLCLSSLWIELPFVLLQPSNLPVLIHSSFISPFLPLFNFPWRLKDSSEFPACAVSR